MDLLLEMILLVVVPGKAGTHLSAGRATAPWVSAVAGTTNWFSDGMA
jgi:hypothetical protein